MPKKFPKKVPGQHQNKQPGSEEKMEPEPIYEDKTYVASGKLKGKVALITGGDSGIGRAVSILFAKEGADLGIVYLNEDKDAQVTLQRIEELGRACVLLKGDIKDPKFCALAVNQTIKHLGKIDILGNNAAVQFVQHSVEDISDKQLKETFETNIFSMFYFCKAALKHLKKGSCIINTTSVTAYHGHNILIDYASTKGAIVAFTRSLALSLIEENIRVNAVAPGPIWTPLIPSSFDAKKVEKFGQSAPMKRPGQPVEVAPCYLFLATSDSTYMTGQVLHPNGGNIVNG